MVRARDFFREGRRMGKTCLIVDLLFMVLTVPGISLLLLPAPVLMPAPGMTRHR